ncbi:MAG: hypothetical protein JWP12_3927 [Bacteroidetes bacterium]|nr:hypothetical protein [Bacteroidota bacterium]
MCIRYISGNGLLISDVQMCKFAGCLKEPEPFRAFLSLEGLDSKH